MNPTRRSPSAAISSSIPAGSCFDGVKPSIASVATPSRSVICHHARKKPSANSEPIHVPVL